MPLRGIFKVLFSALELTEMVPAVVAALVGLKSTAIEQDDSAAILVPQVLAWENVVGDA